VRSVSESVLVVDDSLTARMDLAEAFAAAGFQSLPCGTAAEARDAIERTPFAIVVLDVRLPDSDGVELLKQVRSSAAGASMVVLMLSSEAEVKDRIRALRTGADAFIGKPYDAGYVVARARELLRSRREEPREPGPTILIIDDSVTFREELHAVFRRAGYAVLQAANGEEGLQLAAGQRPSAMVVDGVLPGIDGATVIRRTRLDAALRGIPCLLLTTSEDRGAELRALDAGADAFARKGEDVEIVLAKVAALLRRTAGSGKADTVSMVGRRKILLVDHGAAYHYELTNVLRADGYDVVQARSGAEALDLLAFEPVDCILLAPTVPDVEGRETCHRIKAAPVVRDIPLIMLTARDDRAAILERLSAGADDCIPESRDFEVLKARLGAQIRRKQFEDEKRHIREELLRKELEATEARAARELAETRAALVDELERKNRELESFSYSVSHDLRAPLRSIDGFSQALVEDYGDKLDESGQDYLRRLRAAARRMSELIDDLLQLSRVGRAELRRETVDLSALSRNVVADLERQRPGGRTEVIIQSGMAADADARLVRIVLENLLGNAWKFTANVPQPKIDVAKMEVAGSETYFVRDNGPGFDMQYADKLFRPFQRLHSEEEFPGTGIGLATTRRIIERHAGKIWVEATPNQGATFFFTLSPARVAGR
jgi:two-component system NtrC family sensor kinase